MNFYSEQAFAQAMRVSQFFPQHPGLKSGIKHASRYGAPEQEYPEQGKAYSSRGVSGLEERSRAAAARPRDTHHVRGQQGNAP